MNNILSVMNIQIKNFIGQGKSVYFVYSIVLLVWSSVLASNMRDVSFKNGELWWVFFSVMVSGMFSNTVFVSERISGALEILLTSGISRKSILLGKVLYVFLMSNIMGFICYVLAILWFKLITGNFVIDAVIVSKLLSLYIFSSFMNVSSSAWLSIYLPNPRLSHFVSLLFLSGVIFLHETIQYFFPMLPNMLFLMFGILGLIFLIASVLGFNGERILKPVNV